MLSYVAHLPLGEPVPLLKKEEEEIKQQSSS